MFRPLLSRPTLLRPISASARFPSLTPRPLSSNRSPVDESSRDATASTPYASPDHTDSDHPKSQETRPQNAQDYVREWSERTAITLRERTDLIVARLSSSFSQLGGKINKVTGYEEIEALKRSVVSQEARIAESRNAAREAKVAYEEAVQQRSNSQREVNDLLQRKSSWTDTDVSRFTSLVRQDHLYEQEEAQAKAAVAASEDEVEREFSALMRSILARYHEEQVWSDKIRSVSTYGQLAVLGVNVFVFLLAIVLVEPWKRRRLAQTFERKVEELEARNVEVVTGGMHALEKRLEDQERVLSQLVVEPPPPPTNAPAELVGDVVPLSPLPPLSLKERAFALWKGDMAIVTSSAALTAVVVGWTLRGWFGS